MLVLVVLREAKGWSTRGKRQQRAAAWGGSGNRGQTLSSRKLQVKATVSAGSEPASLPTKGALLAKRCRC